MNPHKLLRASAGTGKTYRLTGRFLQLLVQGVPPERVLATTFTRKAASEIFDRVLKRLVEAVEDDGKRATLDEEIGGGPRTAEAYRALLARLVRHLDRLRVQTLDSFFVQLGKLYALELGLPADWTIADEFEDLALRRAAIGLALARADRGEVLALMRDLQRADAAKRIEADLIESVRDGRDAFLEASPEAWHAVAAPPDATEEEIAAAARALAELELPRTKAGAPVKHWENARRALQDHVAEGNWEGLLGIGLVKKVLAGEVTFSRHPIDDDVVAALGPLLARVAHRMVGVVAARNEALRAWLERFEAAYETQKREERAFRFEDLPQKLAPRDDRTLEERGFDLWYRLDGRIDHLLLDEFQDTSSVQWRILRPVVEEILASGTGERSLFCVGDVKQSIYGWRSAEPRLLASLPERYAVLRERGVIEDLDESYRSSHVVLDTVNRVFSDLAGNGALQERETARAAALAWGRSYPEHLAAKDLRGAATLLEGPPPAPGEKARDAALALAADRAAAIAAEAPGASIGILLRKKQRANRLLRLLGARGLRASGEGGNPLTDSTAVLHVVSLLHLADHPADTVAALHVARSPLAGALDWEPTVDGLAGQAARVSRGVRERLASEGFGGLCVGLRPAVLAGYDAWNRRRFERLVDLAYAFDARGGGRADEFVDAVRETRVEDPTATQVQVMTIHAAKGLEFDAVILPELDEPLVRHTPLLKRRADPAEPFDAVSTNPSQEVRALDPGGLVPLHAAQEGTDLTESFCLLYVAMTRARHRLELIVAAPDRRHGGTSFADVVRAALAPSGDDGDEGAAAGDAGGRVLWRHPGSVEDWGPERAAEGAPAAPAPAAGPVAFAVATEPRGLPRRTPSGQEGDGRVLGAELLRAPRSGARTRGLLVHRWLEEVEWLEDFAFDEARLLARAADLEPDEGARRERLRELEQFLACPGLRELLSRAGQDADPGDELEVWRERSFSTVLPAEGGGEELWSGTFDRVVVRRRGGAVVGARVVDFKTDQVEPGGLEARAEFYRPQMRAYARVAARLLDVDEAAVETRLAFLALDAVVPA